MSGTEKHKVLFVSHWGQRLAGAEYSLLDLMGEAINRADVFLCCSEEGQLTEKASILGIKCKIIACSKNVEKIRRKHLLFNIITNLSTLKKYFLYVKSISEYVSELKPDIIHSNIPKSHIAAALLRFTGYRGLLIFHVREIFDRMSLTSFLYLILFTGKKCCIIAISNAVKDALPKRLRKRSLVFYNGVRVENQLPVKEITDKPKFLYLGRIVPWKGCHLIIDAFAKMFIELKDKSGTLDLVGDTLYWDNSYRTRLLQKISWYNLSDKVKIYPHTDDPYQMYHSHDVLCMASDREPFGRVAAEAMGCGLPVISFDSGGIAEIIKNGITGFLVNHNDLRGYADVMMKLAHDRSVTVMLGKNSYEFAKNNLDRGKNIPQIVDYMINKLD